VSTRAVRACWTACAAGGLLVVTGWLAPGASLYLNGYIGAGASQQGFDFHRTISFESQHSWTSIALPAAALAILLVAAPGLAAARARTFFVVVAGIAAAALIHFERAANFTPGHEREGGVYACDRATAEDPGACAGSLLRPALRLFSADIRAGPVGRREGFVLQDGYRAARRPGSNGLEWGLIALLLVAGYASIRLVVQRWWIALVLLVAAALAVLLVLFLQALSGLE
jgi:hypothetical protein